MRSQLFFNTKIKIQEFILNIDLFDFFLLSSKEFIALSQVKKKRTPSNYIILRHS